MRERTIYRVLEEAAEARPDDAALHQPIGNGKYQTYTWTEYKTAAQEIAVGLSFLGFKKGDIVTLYSETRAEFYIADLGIIALGAIAAALYTSLPAADLVRNVRASDAKAIFVENAKSMAVLQAAAGDNALSVRWILLTGEADGILTLKELRRLGRAELQRDGEAFERIRATYTPHDYGILYLTSGATGEPKMGLATHWAIVSNIDMGPQKLPLTYEDRTIAFLPSAHIAQRVVVEFLMIRCVVPVWFSESLTKLPSELRAIRPTFFLAPPRVWERMYSSITTEIRKRSPMQRRVFYAAIGIGARASRFRQQGKPIPAWMKTSLQLFNKLVYSKIRERLGGAIKVAASGAAPLGKDLAEFFASIGIPLIEGYGLTEGGVASLNPINRPKSGSIGQLFDGFEIQIAEDGELLIKSPCVFSGYYKDPVATAAVLRDGWLYTGDIAEQDSEGYLYITGRKKELIVSSNGKKIYPARIESLLKREPVISQVLLIGDKLPYVSALITINPATAKALRGMESFKGRPLSEVVTAEPLHAEIRRAVSDTNKQLASFEQIRKFRILDREFTIESGEVTPTMKVRRGKVLENYKATISELYPGKESD